MYLWAQLRRWRKLSERGWFTHTIARHLHEIPINLSGRHLGLRTNFIWDCHSHGIYGGGWKIKEWALNQPIWLLNCRFAESFGNTVTILYFGFSTSILFYFLLSIGEIIESNRIYIQDHSFSHAAVYRFLLSHLRLVDVDVLCRSALN